jgi:hypothetical protein
MNSYMLSQVCQNQKCWFLILLSDAANKQNLTLISLFLMQLGSSVETAKMPLFMNAVSFTFFTDVGGVYQVLGSIKIICQQIFSVVVVLGFSTDLTIQRSTYQF